MSLERLMLEQQMRAIEDEERRTPGFYLDYAREVATAFHKYFTRLALEGRRPPPCRSTIRKRAERRLR